jgi:hypothetical protein
MSKSSMDLRQMLFEEMESLRAGKSDANRANAVAKLAAQIVSSAKLDLDYSRTGSGGEPVPMYTLQLEGGDE